MASESTFRDQTPRVVHEVFDEEVVVLDLESGSYYSLRGSAAWIFRAAAAGASPGAIAAAFPAYGYADPAHVRAAVDAFLDALVSEGLLARQPDTAAPPARVEIPGGAGEFTPPRFEKFTDMQDLLLLDPIHDVDETGWPRAAAKAGGNPK
jgi:hypothetical protein